MQMNIWSHLEVTAISSVSSYVSVHYKTQTYSYEAEDWPGSSINYGLFKTRGDQNNNNNQIGLNSHCTLLDILLFPSKLMCVYPKCACASLSMFIFTGWNNYWALIRSVMQHITSSSLTTLSYFNTRWLVGVLGWAAQFWPTLLNDWH